jgi:hypothetical protein
METITILNGKLTVSNPINKNEVIKQLEVIKNTTTDILEKSQVESLLHVLSDDVSCQQAFQHLFEHIDFEKELADEGYDEWVREQDEQQRQLWEESPHVLEDMLNDMANSHSR